MSIKEGNCGPFAKKRTITLTAAEISVCRQSLDGIIIAPYLEQHAKGIGYNLSPSELVYSQKKGGLLPIHRNDEEKYVVIKPQDTVLILSHEYIKVDKSFFGTFHARVSNVAQGLGNISTTLDPEWKGMLLLAINNPTRKRIKLQLEKKTNGVFQPCGLVTLVVSCNLDEKTGSEPIPLQLDNPPMRIDIWNSLVDPPYRFGRNASYKNFKELIQELSSFSQKDSAPGTRLKLIQNILDQLRKALLANGSVSAAKSAMLELARAMSDIDKVINDVHELQNKYTALQTAVQELLREHPTLENVYLEESEIPSLTLLDRECTYLILCDEVGQIHEFINAHVEERREGDIFSRLLYRHILPNLGAFVATLFLAYFLLIGRQTNVESYFSKVTITLFPLLLSLVINHFRKK